MTDETFKERLAELEARIDALPEDRRAVLRRLFRETRQRHLQVKTAVNAARNALDDWRLAMKYLVFDREAAAREAG